MSGVKSICVLPMPVAVLHKLIGSVVVVCGLTAEPVTGE